MFLKREESDSVAAVAEVAINCGTFINAIITFVIVAFCIFLVVKSYNNKKKKEPAVSPD